LGRVTGRSSDDETAALILTFVLFFAVSTYGAMVLSGVVEEKSSRTVEVLLARMPARNLLAGKITGIGLLGLAQVAVTALAALIAGTVVDTVDLPAVRGGVIAWAVVWFVLGYALYATVFGTLGSLASRTEDASSITGPVTVVLVVAFMLSFAAIGSPDTTWARLVSWFPATAPFAMPNRIAMGVATWWDPIGAALLTLMTIAGLVVVGGRVYNGAILHIGNTVSLRDAWRATAASTRGAIETETLPITADPTASRPTTSAVGTSRQTVIVVSIAAAVGLAVYALAQDVITGLAVAAAFYAVGVRIAKARYHAHR
jgi:ABC-2 type transport system permease protein